ncbi:MAG: glycoside hydrolase family 43 protein [Tannerellaceae bacterium]|jgi:alpha-N-arabinofuranosidase|nr:glycoside hydrolase family 43 protein [Tannerellaceae bacterium]
MKTTRLFRILLITGCVVCSCKEKTTKEAVFHWFEYQGQDPWFEKDMNSEKEFFNPVVSGFYPDPSICRKGEDYYMVHSTFSYFPGIPLLHSRDLVDWQQIGNVLDRPSQLNLPGGIRLSGGIYAPAITYNEANETFYVITTAVDGMGNFVVKTKDPLKGWSDPIRLPKVGGIDPSLFFDDGGKAYIVHNDGPESEPEYSGHRAIWIHDYDPETDQTFGVPKVIVDGGTDKSKKPVWIEGPHIYKINSTYYLMAAEGGTSIDHSEVIFTSNNIKGPYTPAKENPILTQRDLPENRPEKVTCTGHADLIQTPAGDWYAVFLACRPYEGDMYNTGRETFLLPVTWKNDIPVILPKGDAVPTVVALKNRKPNTSGITTEPFTGNFTWKDEFKADKLGMRWLFIRTPRQQWWQLTDHGLRITPDTTSVYTLGNPSFIGYRQQHTNFTTTTGLSFRPQHEKELAGLVCYQNERFNIVFGKTLREGKECLIVVRTNNGNQQETIYPLSGKKTNPLQLRITAKGALYSFYYLNENNEWIPVATDVDGSILSTKKAGGFTGATIGMYAVK